jgi:pSer/pThr/pTyr-binding forkhead associated (FHA) protein
MLVRNGGTIVGNSVIRILMMDIPLSTPMASRHHAVVYVEDGRPLLEDLGSANGTFLNGDLVKKAVPCNRDIFRVGETLVHYVQDEELSDSKHMEVAEWMAVELVHLYEEF